ncbi:MAG: hypothetical protein RL096_986, partial [Actinomycetota bacterium]
LFDLSSEHGVVSVDGEEIPFDSLVIAPLLPTTLKTLADVLGLSSNYGQTSKMHFTEYAPKIQSPLRETP